jgi:DNA-binding transcriptional LysR family regulator
MELQQLRYFVSTARAQHMSRAAAEHHVAQPSLSKSIRLLETELGVDLFERTGGGVRLNAFGRAFLRHVEKAFKALADGRHEIEDMVSVRRDELVVSAVSLFWAAGLFISFSEMTPAVRFRLYQRTQAEMIQQLERRKVDLCLMTDPALETVEWIPLVTGDVYVVVPPGHRLQGRVNVGLQDLRGEPAVMPRSGGPLRELIDRGCREAGVAVNVVCETDDVSVMRELVSAGLGLQFVPDLRHVLSAGGDATCLRLTAPTLAVHLGLAWVRGGYRSRTAQNFATFAQDHFKTQYPSP